MSLLQIYRASAGSGKTHILTQEYLKQAFANPAKFMGILAVTFTNKAAEEMKFRVLSELHKLSKDSSQSSMLREIQQAYPHLSIRQIEQLAQSILEGILHNYSSFSISTIDSFVQRVVRAFSLEIGAQSGYKIELNQQTVIDELTKMLYRQLNNDNNLLRWLRNYALYRIEQGKNWDFREEISTLAAELFKEKFQLLATSIDSDDQPQQSSEERRLLFDQLYHELLTIKRNFESEMKQTGEKVVTYLSKNQVEPQSLGRNFGTIVNYLSNKILNTAKPADYIPNQTVHAAQQGVENWHAKTAKAPIINEVKYHYSTLSPLLEQVMDYYREHFTQYLSARNILANFHALGVMNDLASLLPVYRNKKNVLLISDTNLILRNIIANNETPFVYEKLGTRYKNILIDEFQDTSKFQWDNFRPLIINSLADGQFNLIVGDIKQSIYRWRGGDWNLLLSQVSADIGRGFIAEQSLATNWRSLKSILDFNNAIFDVAPSILQLSLNIEMSEIDDELVKNHISTYQFNDLIQRTYSDSFQKLSPKTTDKPGFVEMRFFKVENRMAMTKRWRSGALEYLPQLINRLIFEQGYQPADITILIRKNKDGTDITNSLLEYMESNSDSAHYQIVSSESLFIEQAASVQLLINALRFIYNQMDTIALTATIRFFNLLQNKPLTHQHFDRTVTISSDSDFLPADFLSRQNELIQLPIYELTEQLIALFKLNYLYSELPYIQAFQDTTLTCTRNEITTVHSYLEWWDLEGKNTSLRISETLDAVRIMTIHKAKGLAFKIVIMPFCDWRLDHDTVFTAPFLWCKSNIPPFDQFPYLPVRYKSELLNTVFQNEYLTEKLAVTIDSLNLLYVATTRPVEQLFLMAPTDCSGNLSSISDLLYQSLQQTQLANLHKAENDETLVYEIGEPIIKPEQEKANETNSQPSYITIEDYPSNDWRDRIVIFYNSQEFFIESDEYLEERVNYGTLMHKILARIKTQADIDKAVDELNAQGLIAKSQQPYLQEKTMEIINYEQAKDWFSDRWIIKTESALLSASGNLRIPDRVLLGDNETIIIDFKFAQAQPEHQIQVAEYISLLADMAYPNVKGFLYYPDLKRIEQVTL